jgi:hypothetical protein
MEEVSWPNFQQVLQLEITPFTQRSSGVFSSRNLCRRESFEGKPVFNLVELKSSEVLTYWTLQAPRMYDYNNFRVSRNGLSQFYSVNLNFREKNQTNGPAQDMRFPCKERTLNEPVIEVCSCGAGYECDEYGDCVDVSCEGGCPGTCNGYPEGTTCVTDLTLGQYTCVNPCETGACGSKCPNEKECVEDSNGNFSC